MNTTKFFAVVFLAILFFSIPLESSVQFSQPKLTIPVDRYEKLFLNYQHYKAIKALQGDATIVLTAELVGKRFKRPKLVVWLKTTTEEIELDPLWFQPSLAYFVYDKTAIITLQDNTVVAYGLPDYLLQE